MYPTPPADEGAGGREAEAEDAADVDDAGPGVADGSSGAGEGSPAAADD